MSRREVWKLRVLRSLHDGVMEAADLHARGRQKWEARGSRDDQMVNEHTSPHIFDPLPGPKHFRLLELLPGDDGADLVCNLGVHLLEEAPPFEAVSYVWGDRLPRCDIICGDQRITIGPSLDWGLRRVRKKDASRILWVDALCINQIDLAEKSQQIRLMRPIYARADQVLVWLGADDHDEGDIVTVLMYRFWKMHQKDSLDDGIRRHLPTPPSMESYPDDLIVEDFNMAELNTSKWHPVKRLFSNSWFSRIWIVQEALSAQRLLCYLGEKHLRLDFVGPMAFCLLKYAERHGEIAVDPGFTRALASAGYIWGLGTKMKATNNKIYLHEILIKGFLSSCTDPRDRIYALLGVTYEGRQLEDSKSLGLLLPDYTKSRLEVYRDAARYIATTPNEHDPKHQYRLIGIWAILYLAGPLSSWPSWVPWWHEAGSTSDFIIWFCEANYFLPAYTAARTTAITTRPSDPSTLSLRGIFVDKVMLVEPIPGQILQEGSKYACWEWMRCRWRRYMALLPDIDGAVRPASLVDAFINFALVVTNVGEYLTQAHMSLFWDALEWFRHHEDLAVERMKVAGVSEEDIQLYRDETQIPTTEHVNLAFDDEANTMPEMIKWLRWRNHLTPNLMDMFGIREPEDQQAFIKSTEENYPQTTSAARAAAKADRLQIALGAGKSNQSALIVTQKGLLGLACRYTQVDDVLCVPYGCPVPILLHPVRSHYKHRGFAHFPALMSGRAMELRDAGVLEEAWFDIR